MKLTPGLYSPAYPMAWLLFGMLFALAVAHFMAIPWLQLATVTFYSVAFAWVSVLAWREQRHIWSVTIVRPFLSVRQGSYWSADAFVLTPFTAFLVVDQLHGDYFMSVGTWLMLGIAASMRANEKRGCENRG